MDAFVVSLSDAEGCSSGAGLDGGVIVGIRMRTGKQHRQQGSNGAFAAVLP